MKQKETFKERLIDALLELVLGAVFVAIGIGLIYLFGENPWDMDFESLALIGVGAFLALAAAIGGIVCFIKKKKKGNKNEPS